MSALDELVNPTNWYLNPEVSTDNGHEYAYFEWVGDDGIHILAATELAHLRARLAELEKEKADGWYDALAMGAATAEQEHRAEAAEEKAGKLAGLLRDAWNSIGAHHTAGYREPGSECTFCSQELHDRIAAALSEKP